MSSFPGTGSWKVVLEVVKGGVVKASMTSLNYQDSEYQVPGLTAIDFPITLPSDVSVQDLYDGTATLQFYMFPTGALDGSGQECDWAIWEVSYANPKSKDSGDKSISTVMPLGME